MNVLVPVKKRIEYKIKLRHKIQVEKPDDLNKNVTFLLSGDNIRDRKWGRESAPSTNK